MLDLAPEFFRWELATATAGALLGINPFDQPNVQESKDNTNRLLALVRQQGRLPQEEPALTAGDLKIYATQAAPTLAGTFAQFLKQARPGEYLALLVLLTADDPEDAQVPGRPLTFGVFKQAQALGDLEALRRHGRRVLRLHLGANPAEGLAQVNRAVGEVLRGGPGT